MTFEFNALHAFLYVLFIATKASTLSLSLCINKKPCTIVKNLHLFFFFIWVCGESTCTLTRMKVVGFWALFLLVEAALVFLTLTGSSAQGNAHDFAQDMSSLSSEDNVAASTSSISELTKRSNTQKTNNDKINLEDYSQIDPAPSSSAAVTSGPIENGTPLMPYIPKPTPPYHRKHSGSSLLPSPA